MTRSSLTVGARLVYGVILLGLIVLGVLHSMNARGGDPIRFAMLFMFVSLSVTLLLSMSHRGVREEESGTVEPKKPPRLGVSIPAYNEDPAFLAAGLHSLAVQTLLPKVVIVVDDGSTTPVLNDARVRTSLEELVQLGVDAFVLRQENAGKRHAQVASFRHPSAAGLDVWVTIDSDTVMHAEALRNIAIPFRNEQTMAVAGMLYGNNHKRSLLTRTLELSCAMSFLNGRAAEGAGGAVRVNCGGLAAYRASIIDKNLDRYLSQTYLGQTCTSGDDRALTIYARELGRTEFQPTAIGYTALPVNISHLLRQRLRWARSWYWGTWWLLSRPLNTIEFWLTVVQVFGTVAYLCVMIALSVLIIAGVVTPWAIPIMAGVAAAITTVHSFRYVVMGRKDVSVWDRLLTWLCAPLSTALYMFALNPLYWIAAFQQKRMGWGTRESVEVDAAALKVAA